MTTLVLQIMETNKLRWFLHIEIMTVDRVPHNAMDYMKDSKENETKADPDRDG